MTDQPDPNLECHWILGFPIAEFIEVLGEEAADLKAELTSLLARFAEDRQPEQPVAAEMNEILNAYLAQFDLHLLTTVISSRYGEVVEWGGLEPEVPYFVLGWLINSDVPEPFREQLHPTPETGRAEADASEEDDEVNGDQEFIREIENLLNQGQPLGTGLRLREYLPHFSPRATNPPA